MGVGGGWEAKGGLNHPLSGTIHPVVDRHGFTWSDKCCL